MIFPASDNESELWAEESEDLIWGAWECLLFPSGSCGSQPCRRWGRSFHQKICEHVGCKQDTVRLRVASTWQSDAPQIPAASREPTCYHPTTESASLSEGSLEFSKAWGFVYQALLLILRTGVQSITKYSPPTDGKEQDLASPQPTKALVWFSSLCIYISV